MKTFESFLAEKSITKEQFSAKEAEEMASLYNEFNAENTKTLEELVAAKSDENASAITELKGLIEETRVEQMKSINETLKQYGLQIKKLTEKEKSALPKDGLKDGLTSNIDKIKAMRETREGVSFKVAGDMTIAGNVSGGNVPVEQRIAGMDAIASRRVRLMDIVSRGVAESNVISWVSQANKDGAAGGTAEGALKNQIDFDLVVASENVKKRTAFVKVSDEMKGDIGFMQSEINNELMRELLKDVESQVYEGDGTGNNLNGIKTTASAFVATTSPSAVENANIVDVLRVAATQIKIADHDAPTYHLVNPVDMLSLMLIKVTSTDKRYIDALQLIAGQLTLDGVPIIETTLVTADEYLTGNFSLATVYDKGEIDIEMGLDGDDFTKNLMTIRAEWRGAAVVRTNKRSAFVTGVFSTDITALEAIV